MIFQTLNTYVDHIEVTDIERISDIYNSNSKFLDTHMDKNSVDAKWVENEIAEMKKIEFQSCKIISKEKKEIIGFSDFKIKETSYISLLMIHKDFKCKGLGREVYEGLERYMKDRNSNAIRIDVVTGYSKNVTKFWIDNGFEILDEIKLNWEGKELPVVIMKKTI